MGSNSLNKKIKIKSFNSWDLNSINKKGILILECIIIYNIRGYKYICRTYNLQNELADIF